MIFYTTIAVAIAAIYVLSSYLIEARRENRRLKRELRKQIKSKKLKQHQNNYEKNLF